MTGLCGLGGIGKTTIAKEVAKNQKIFEKVIMTTVSQELNIEKIQGQIAEKLSLQLNENNKDVRAFHLCERLKQEKNMLLILDDLWEELDLGKSGIPFVSVENYSKKNKGCKILLTSRNKMLLSDLMKCQKIVEVGVLLEDEALELFKKIAELSTDSSSPELISIATQASNELHVFIHRRLKEWPDENILQVCEGICLQESDISDLPEELHGPRLQFFLLNSTKRDLNIPRMFFKSSKELKVLAFTNVHFLSLSSLIFLHKLKALCLHSCLLEDIAEVRSLKNLKVLSLAYSKIQRLPIKLAVLTSLQMMNLSHCSNLKEIPKKLLSSLKKLEVLHMGNSFH